MENDSTKLFESKQIRTAWNEEERNIERFPEDFMFRLTKEDVEFLKSQNVILEMGTNKNLIICIPNADFFVSA